MARLHPQSYKNFSGGYTREQAKFSEKFCQFVEGSKNIDIKALQGDGYGFEAIAGNTALFTIANEKILNLYTYEGGTEDYLLIHTDAGKVYEYNETTGLTTAIKTGLTTSATRMGFANITVDQLVGDPLMMGFFTNGIDVPFVYIKGNTPEVQNVTAVDSESRTLKSNICLAFNGSMWMAVGNRIHWSKQLDPFDWSAASDAGYKSFDSPIIGMIVYNGEIVVSTSNGFHRVVSNGDGTYSFYTLSGGQVANSDCLTTHDAFALYFSGRELYPIEPSQQDKSIVKNSLSYPINKDLENTDKDNCHLIEVTVQGRNEVWLHIQGATTSSVYILRYKKGYQDYNYWLPPRIQQKINCLHVFKEKILSGTDNGVVLEELLGDSCNFNGVFYPSMAITPKINFGNYSGKQQCTPILFLDNLRDNTFAGRYIINGDTSEPELFDIIANNADSLIWDSDTGLWADEAETVGGIWAMPALTRVDLDQAVSDSSDYECSLQIIFETKKLGDDFSIQGLDLTRIKKKAR